MNRERKLAALRRALNDQGYVKNDEASFFCKNPKGCDGKHHKRKLAVNIKTDVFHCWVCGHAGRSLLPLLRYLGPEDADYREYAAEVERPKDEVSKVYDKVRLPSEFRPLSVPCSSPYYRQAIGYLTDRGITSEDILTYRMGYCEEGRYAERIIIPSFDEYGELNFFVGRSWWERVSPPYLSGKFDKDIIFNDLLVDWRRDITIVEGPFDAIKTGTQAIPLQGKFLSQKLIDKLIAFKPHVNVMLDSDAWVDANSIMEKLLSYGIDVSYVNLGKFKDPGEMTREQIDEAIGKAKRVHSKSDLMVMKVRHSSSIGAA